MRPTIIPTKIYERLEKHYLRAVQHYGPHAVLGVFLYGSQNYNTDTPESDVDTKCILIPNIRSLACHPYEVKHLAVDDEVCECMPIQHMVANWKKQNINFVEILFTPYKIINTLYEEEWNRFIVSGIKDDIAAYDIKKAVLSMANQALHTYRQNPNDFKKQMNMTRICASLHRLTEGWDYWHCIHFEDEVAEELRDIRANGADEADIKDRLENLEWYIEHAGDWSADPDYKEEIDWELEDWIVLFIKRRLHEEGFSV